MGAKVLTIGASSGTTTPVKKETTLPKDTPTNKPDAGSKVTANKALAASTPTASGKTSPAPSGGKSSPASTVTDVAAQKREADAVAKEQEEEVDDSTLAELYGKVC